jgi:meso-butanediol dehydrogenase / (S,S)-butanediol dehydrogenase / diacetyl reductase
MTERVDSGRYAGKRALVTGGGSGIGAAIARRLLAEGARVTTMGRHEAALREVCESYVVGDVAIAADCARAVEQCGPLDLLVNNAGTVGGESFAATIAINLTGPHQLIELARPGLIERQGSIVNIASTAAIYSGASAADYNTSKAGLVMLTRSLAVELGPLGVRANAVCPGWVRTPAGVRTMSELGGDLESAWTLASRNTPLRRPGTPEKIAATVAFLGSDDASYITGAVLMADGGSSAVDVLMVDYERRLTDA